MVVIKLCEKFERVLNLEVHNITSRSTWPARRRRRWIVKRSSIATHPSSSSGSQGDDGEREEKNIKFAKSILLI